MKNGDAFEVIVALVQSSIRNHPEINIALNQLILDIAGNKREIDVLLSTQINNLQLQVAIECKDYKYRVSAEKVDAFKSKCEAIPSINKLVMISKVGFQKGAISKAAIYGIDLITMNQINESIVGDWFSSFNVRPMQVNRTLTNIGLDFVNDPIDDFQQSDIVIVENGVKQMTLLNLVQDIIDLTIAQPRFRSTISDSLPEEVKRESSVNLKDTYILRNNIKSYVKSIFIEVTDTYTTQGGLIRNDIYKGKDDSPGMPVHTIIADDGNIFSAIKKSDHEIDLIMRVSPKEDSLQRNTIIKLATIRTQ